MDDYNFDSLMSLNQSTVPMEQINVTVDTEMFSDFANAFVNEAYRIDPIKAEQVGLNAEELTKYIKYLLHQRTLIINGESFDRRELRLMYIPAWIQYNIRMIGKVIIRESALSITPQVYNTDDMISAEEALKISDKVGSFEERMQIVRDAMPFDPSGDKDVMTTAMIQECARSIFPVTHPSSTYVTAFMNMKLAEETAFKVLYRIQYDDANYIRSALLAQKELFR